MVRYTEPVIDGGAYVVDTRSGERLEVSDSAAVVVEGDNFAPLEKLSCVFRRTGETFFDTFEHAVPASFVSSRVIRCPIPYVTHADDGLTLSSKMFFSVSNDGETYRYSTHTFTYVGDCVMDAFHVKLYFYLRLAIGVAVLGLLAGRA